MPSNDQNKALKGENCTLINIAGVKSLVHADGTDLLKLIKSSDSGNVMAALLSRIDALEKTVQQLKVQGGKEGKDGKNGVDGKDGKDGKNGKDGLEGPPGPPGPQGPRGLASGKLQDLSDVNMDGLDDGATLAWSAKQKKFTMAMLD